MEFRNIYLADPQRIGYYGDMSEARAGDFTQYPAHQKIFSKKF